GLLRQPFAVFELIEKILGQSSGVEPLILFAGGFDLQPDSQPRAQHGLGAQHVLEPRNREFLRIEELRIRPEAHRGSGIVLADGADLFELPLGATILETDVVFLATTSYPALEILRERIDDRDPNTMQAAGELVVLIGEFPARVQPREDQFHARNLLFRVDVDRHTAAVVFYFERTILVKG